MNEEQLWYHRQFLVEKEIHDYLIRVRREHEQRDAREKEMVNNLEVDPRRLTIDGIPKTQWMFEQPLRVVNLYCKRQREGYLS